MSPSKTLVVLSAAWLYSAAGFTAEPIEPTSASPSALTITMNGIGPAVDGKALNRANKLIQSGLKQGFLTEQVNYHQGIEGGLSTCVTIKANTSEKQIISFEKKLRAIKPNPRTTVYGFGRTSSCTTQPAIPPSWQGEQTTQSGVTEAQQLVIKDEQAWEALWGRHTAQQNPARPVPPIDFSKQMVLAVFLGERPANACYSVRIDPNFTTNSQKLVVNYTESTSVDDLFFANCVAAITHPAAMIVINRSDLPVEFVNLSPSSN